MDKPTYNIDALLDRNRPVVRLRGTDYRMADRAADERLSLEADYDRARVELDKLVGKPETAPEVLADAMFRFQRVAVSIALEDVPDEIVRVLSEHEHRLINRAYLHWRGIEWTAADLLKADELSKNGGSAAGE